ncbi:epimerase/racemase [Lithospermum erythrorhizon]|uniref:Epimerase/racemase n=1 Tax=Lithospermum erythrorhizon TaxID=34254 RepID=A0AAV3Q7Z9_LITER
MAGFPGDLAVMVTCMFVGSNKLAIKMEAKPQNKATPVNIASHTYWNLGGHNSGTILSHDIQLFASSITPVDKNLIPTGDYFGKRHRL